MTVGEIPQRRNRRSAGRARRPRLRLGEQALLEGEAEDLGARPQAELVAQPRAVRLDGLDAQREAVRDLAVGVALRDQHEDLALALAQEVVAGPRRGLLGRADRAGDG